MGIISDIPIFWLLPVAIIAFGLSYLYYRKGSTQVDFSHRIKWVLTLLRGTSLTLIILLLLGVILENTTDKKENPIIVTLIDDSKSMLNYSDSLLLPSQVSELLADLQENFGNNAELLSMNLAMDGVDSLSFDRVQTNYDAALTSLFDQYGNRNLGAVVLVADGNYNRGRNPLYMADRLGFTPIYALGVGDSLQKRDVLISQVSYNDIAFLGNKFPIVVNVEAHQSPTTDLKIGVYQNDKVVAEKALRTGKEDYVMFQESFLIEAQTVGFREYVIKVSEVEGESNYINNRKSVFIEVIDSRNKILLLSAAPHPDLGAIKNTLVQDANLEVEAARIGKQEHPLNAYDLIIWHDPGVDFDSRLMAEIQKHGTPVWFVLGPRSQGQFLSKLPLGLEARSGRQTDDVQAKFNSSFSLFEFSKEGQDLVDRFPPLTINFGSLALNKRADVLLYQKVGPVVKKEPAFFFVADGAAKYGVTYGEGIWRWRLNNFARTGDHKVFDELVNKTVQYLMLRANTSQLRVNLPRQFHEGENVVFGASFYNESLEPITSVTINLKLVNTNGEEFEYAFTPQSTAYTLDLGNLKAGAYEWIASTEFENRKFKKNGGFVVRELSIESLDTKSNFALMNQLAESTNGDFYLLADYARLIHDLKQRDDIVPVTYMSTAYKKLIDYKWWFVLLVLLLFSEWVIRRYNGTY
jgi:hypothetical protein